MRAYDFRSPAKLPSAAVRELTDLHKAFARGLSDRLSRELRTTVAVEQIGAEQLSYDGYVRSMPVPNLLTIVALDPLPGNVVMEMSPQLGLVLVDRLLGGPGRPVAPREPTELEQTILGTVLDHPIAALGEALADVVAVTPRFVTSELNPQLAHAASPGEAVLVLTFSIVAEASGPATRGLISVCYPLATLTPIRDAARQARWGGGGGTGSAIAALHDVVMAAPIELAVRTRATAIRADQLVGLAPGDVVGLDHAVDEPLLVDVEGRPLMTCEVGRRADSLAIKVKRWM